MTPRFENLDVAGYELVRGSAPASRCWSHTGCAPTWPTAAAEMVERYSSVPA